MNSGRDRMRMNVEGDIISSLPDDLIAKILSFIGTKQAVETSTLSSRWRFIWTKIHYLNFSSEDFSTLRKFHKFFTRVLSSCNNQVEMSLNLHGKVNSAFVLRILNQACSHNLRQLTFTFLDEKNIKCPLSLFSSHSLKHLTLIRSFDYHLIPTSMWELPALTSLHLEHITLYDDNTGDGVGFFSKCTNLKSLTIIDCLIKGMKSFFICHPQLLNITFKHRYSFPNVINVVAPQLKNLTINGYDGMFRISTPDLRSLLYKNRTLKLSIDVDSLPSLEKVDLCISHTWSTDARKVVDLLQKFGRVKFLTLSLEVIELLSSSVEVIACEPSPFVNMRTLRIHPELFEPQEREVSMATEVKNYLVDTSPSATFTLVTREDIRAVRDAELAQNLVADLRVLLILDKLKEDKRHQACTKMSFDMWKSESQIKSYRKGLIEEIKQGETKTRDIESLVQRIKDLLIKLPTSKKAEMQPRFSILCAEADFVISKIVNCKNARFAQNLMAKLRLLLDLEKALMQKHKEDERQQSCTKMPLDMRKRESQVHSYWQGLHEEIRKGKLKTSEIISLLQKIKRFLIKLPMPDKVELQSCFTGLCAEADNVISKIVNRMKVECDTKGSGLIVNFHELIEAAQASP